MNRSNFSKKRSSTLPVVLPICWIEHLTQLAYERGINRSALVREALQQVFFTDTYEACGSNKDE